MHLNSNSDGQHGAARTSSSSQLRPQRYERLWFSDGNVVLATDSLLVRVHRGVLSLQSTVFKDMFDFPTTAVDDAPNTSEVPWGAGEKPDVFEGLPMVSLAGDRGEDIVHLLRAAYERGYYDQNDDNTPLEVVTTLLILSTKYDFAVIRRDVIKHLSRHYPTALNEFDAVDANTSTSLFGLARKECHFPLLRAALKAEADVLLPALYYACSAFSLAHIFDHEAHQLELETVKTLLVGARKVESTIRTLLLMILDGATSSSRTSICSATATGGQCNIRRRSRSYAMSHMFNTACLADVKGEKVVAHCLKNACASCRASIAGGIDDARAVLWERIPGLFGFPGWEVLRATS